MSATLKIHSALWAMIMIMCMLCAFNQRNSPNMSHCLARCCPTHKTVGSTHTPARGKQAFSSYFICVLRHTQTHTHKRGHYKVCASVRDVYTFLIFASRPERAAPHRRAASKIAAFTAPSTHAHTHTHNNGRTHRRRRHRRGRRRRSAPRRDPQIARTCKIVRAYRTINNSKSYSTHTLTPFFGGHLQRRLIVRMAC